MILEASPYNPGGSILFIGFGAFGLSFLFLFFPYVSVQKIP
jgi:hypothetical protein